MKTRFLTIGLIMLVLYAACTSKRKVSEENGLLRIDFTQKLEERAFILNDIAEDLRLVSLETTEESQISYFGGYAGESYIFSMNNDKLLLFDRDGQLLDIIAVKGQGPGEFTQIDAFDIDDREKYLVFHDRGKDFLYRYKLDTREYEDKIEFRDEGYLGGLIALNDTSVAILRSSFSDYEHLWFIQDTQGDIRAGLKQQTITHPGSWSGMWPIFIKTPGNKILYQVSDVDTVYSIIDGAAKAAIIMNTDKPVKNGVTEEGYSARLNYAGEKLMLFSLSYFEKTETANSASMRINKTEHIVYNKKSSELFIASPLNIEYYGMAITLSRFSILDNARFYAQFQALDFRNKLEEELGKPDLDEANSLKLTELLNSISEDDNPILLVGRLSMN